uniref:Pyrin domain-containing protein n=1 Tax=Mola mola TaxID=94237 RepID=A0A3Q3WCN0_MOLML
MTGIESDLLPILEDLNSGEFRMFTWYLSLDILENCKPIPKGRLENKIRVETVDLILQSYREELAVMITAEILRKMQNNKAAEALTKNLLFL